MSSTIQRVFHQTMLQENNTHEVLPNILDSESAPMNINRMIIVYSKPKSLRNFLFPRSFDKTAGPTCTHYLESSDFKHLFSKRK